MKIRNLTSVKSIFFGNLGVQQTIFKNTFWIALSTGISKILRAILIIYLARVLGATDYGTFSFALAFVSLFVSVSNFGLSSIITREFSREAEEEKEFSSLLAMDILFSFLALILVVGGSFFIAPDPDTQKIIWILAAFSFVSQFPEVFYALFRARQKMEYESFMNIFQVVAMTAAIFFVIFNFPSIRNVSYGYLFSGAVTLILFLIFFNFKILPLKLSFKTEIWKKYLKMSWPLALTSIFGMLYNYIDSIMMGYLGQITETGWYNAALKIINIATVPPAVIALSFYPALSKFALPGKDQIASSIQESKMKLQEIWDRQLEITILSAIPLVVGGMFLAPRIIDFVYGRDFSSAALALQILIFMAGVLFIYTPFFHVLIASGQQKKLFWATLIGAVINISLNLILIPRFSLYGAAIATVITHTSIFLLYFWFTLRFTLVQPLNLKFFLTSSVAIFSSFIMYFVISRPQIYQFNIFLLVAIAILIYAIITFFILKFMLSIF